MTDGTGLIKRFYEDVIGRGQINLIDELVAEDITDHEQGLPGQPSGREGVKFFVNAMREAFPDIQAKAISPTLTDGNLEAAHVVLTGTHQGELMGVAATNRPVEFESLDIIRVEDGAVVEHWGITDTMGLMQQLGAIPE